MDDGAPFIHYFKIFAFRAKCKEAILQERNVHGNKDALLNLKQACHVEDFVYICTQCTDACLNN